MLRIGLFGTSDSLGGTEVYMISMVRLLKNEVRFDYIVGHNVKHIPFEDEIKCYGGRIFREYYYHRERRMAEYISPATLIRKHPEWDGVYINVQQIHTAYNLLVAAKMAGMKYRIIHAHNAGYSINPRVKDKIYDQYFQLTKGKVVTHFLACSDVAGKWMFGKKQQFTVIPNAIDFSKFAPSEDKRKKMRDLYEIKDNEILLGFCGRLSYQKRPEMLIEIMRCLQTDYRYRLLIIGDGVLETSMRKLVQEYGLDNRVIFSGKTDQPEQYYQMMDCFVLPSRFEGFGIVLLEAQAAGLRCYTTEKVVPAEVNITGRVTFLSLDANAEEWVKAIQKNDIKRVDCIDEMERSKYSLSAMKEKLNQVFLLHTNNNE